MQGSDDGEWYGCLKEASTIKKPSAMRQLFAVICSHDNLQNPLPAQLWQQFRVHMLEDFKLQFNDEESKTKALLDIEKTLKSRGFTCSQLGLPDPGPNSDAVQFDALTESEAVREAVDSLNPVQRQVFDKIINCLDYETLPHRCFFIDGSGGTGKTYLYNTLINHLRGQNKTVLMFATTGIAACLLQGGRTVHSGFKLSPGRTLGTFTSNVKIPSQEAENLAKTDLIIIDEASMLTKDALQCINLILQKIMINKKPFGGKVIVLGGDFRQTLPVVPRGTKADILEASVKSSSLWRHFEILTLSTNMRSKDQDDFNEFILNIGDGESNDSEGNTEIPASFIESNDLIDTIYGNSINSSDINALCNKIILTTTNKRALELNNRVTRLINEELHTYKSADSIISDDFEDYPVEYLNSLTPSGTPPHTLKLKKGCIIMLVRNLDEAKGLYNGTRLSIKDLFTNFIHAKILTGTHKDEDVFIPRLNITTTDTDLPFDLKRRQFPIILAFSITIHKAQGQSFDTVGLFLPEPVFVHGQLYVALSRTKDSKKLKIVIKEGQGKSLGNGNVFTKNFVYPEIFSNDYFLS